MEKLIKIVLLMAVIGGGVALLYNYSEVEETAQEIKTKAENAPDDAIQPQEKYGFAPMGTGI
ncbi:MAG: hypothetical protein IID37_09795 [Planctomycetes bacterium]|nr:hypothetical protein [Planctomycetota bacterium]